MTVGDPQRDRRSAPYHSKLRVPNLIDIDFKQLRRGRLARLQQAMRNRDVAVCLLYTPANIRYATGTDLMGIWTMSTLARYCVVPADGDPIMFEYGKAHQVSDKYVSDVRDAKSWQMMGDMSADLARDWARQIKATMTELGAGRERLAIDKLDVFAYHALEAEGITLLDAGPTTVAAREIKTKEEVELFMINGGIGDAMIYNFEQAIRPGVREFELLSVLAKTLFDYHGEYLFTRVVASGRNTNPWLTEAHDKIVQPGDLVAVDTDAVGFEGYVIDVSRTFLCGDEASESQKEAYRIAYDCVTGMVEQVKPGMSYEAFSRLAPALPEAYRKLRYVSMCHPAGLEDESPGIPYLYDDARAPKVAPEVEIRENMVLCFECYAGRDDENFGVKLEDQVLITKDGAVPLSTYPFEKKLL